MGKLFAILMAFVIFVPSMLGYVRKSKEIRNQTEKRMTYGYDETDF